jgi:hypothetical protein
MLATKSAFIGEADPKRVASAKERKAKERKEKYIAEGDGKTMDDKWASLLRESEVGDGVSEESAVEKTPGGAKKRRGKKTAA